MSTVIVNDASSRIDIAKGGLLAELCTLPDRLVVQRRSPTA